MTQEPLLVELLTEELPPKSLAQLSEAFVETFASALRNQEFLTENSIVTSYATPRRLAIVISHVRDRSPDREVTKRGPSLSAAIDSEGKPTPALLGFAKSRGVSVTALQREVTTKGEFFIHRDLAAGRILQVAIHCALEDTFAALPLVKAMRWGDADEQFVRPVRGLVIMHGTQIIDGAVFGCVSANATRGHRFMSADEIVIPGASEYEIVLEEKGSVIPSFTKRRGLIERELRAAAQNFDLALDEALLDEVTALTEYPAIYEGRFDEDFLAVPNECLVLAMQQHQRYVPLMDRGRLLPRFLVVANIETDDPSNIIRGNERVLRARLADAKFFFDQDRKVELEYRLASLAKVIYHNKLGTQLERVERLTELAAKVARLLDADIKLAERAARLCKADLATEMVGEFPELQGVMGRYYALHDGEQEAVANAIEQHYRPRFSGDALPQSAVSISVALADKLEALAGMFGIGQQPSGDKDPFALRRHALGVVRIIVEGKLPVALSDLLSAAVSVFPSGMIVDARADLEVFIFERLRSYLREQGYSANEVEAVLSLAPSRLDVIPQQLAAVRAFASLPEAESLAAANKRVVNILKQADARGESYTDVRRGQPSEPAERALSDALATTSKRASSLFSEGDFTGYLKSFAVLKSPVDEFFDSVMVMVDNPQVRRNRLALLAELRREMNRIADISKLAA